MGRHPRKSTSQPAGALTWVCAPAFGKEPEVTNTPPALPFKTRELYSWSEAAAYLGPSFTERWVKRQVYDFKTIKVA